MFGGLLGSNFPDRPLRTMYQKVKLLISKLSSRAAKNPLLFILIDIVCVGSCAFAFANIHYVLEDDNYVYLFEFGRSDPSWMGLFILLITVITCMVAILSIAVVMATFVRRFKEARDRS